MFYIMRINENIKVFKNTLWMSKTIYKDETRKSMKETEVIINGADFLTKGYKNKKQSIRITNKGSVATILGVVTPSRVAVLNFADALTPGGLVFEGIETQEEDLCRCSNLYPCISQDKVFDDYYGYNRSLENDIYSDRLIYSKDVLFFKDEDYWCIPIRTKCDVITCPAPVECSDKQVFVNRIKCIIGATYSKGVDTLVLGGWGTGAFGNDSYLVATAFKEVLDEYKLFDVVYFPFKCSETDPSDNYKVFKEVLL